jgi:hypothetical protein
MSETPGGDRHPPVFFAGSTGRVTASTLGKNPGLFSSPVSPDSAPPKSRLIASNRVSAIRRNQAKSHRRNLRKPKETLPSKLRLIAVFCGSGRDC